MQLRHLALTTPDIRSLPPSRFSRNHELMKEWRAESRALLDFQQVENQQDEVATVKSMRRHAVQARHTTLNSRALRYRDAVEGRGLLR